MAKDPAFLFYSNDFLTGTLTMSHEDRGKYIYLLCIMHQQGRQDEETIRFLVGSVSDKLRLKFQVDENGKWFNERLESEIEKRAIFIESRKNNGKLGGRPKANSKPSGYPSAYPNGKPKNNLAENVNEIENEVKNPSLEKSEKPFLKNVSVPWQSDNDFQEIYRQWIDMRMDEHSEDWRDGQHSMLMKELKLYSKHDAMAAISRAIQGNYKVIYPSHSKGNSTEQVLKDLDKKPPPPVMQDSRWEVEKRGNEYFFIEFDGFNKKSGRERKATEHDYQRAQAVS